MPGFHHENIVPRKPNQSYCFLFQKSQDYWKPSLSAETILYFFREGFRFLTWTLADCFPHRLRLQKRKQDWPERINTPDHRESFQQGWDQSFLPCGSHPHSSDHWTNRGGLGDAGFQLDPRPKTSGPGGIALGC